MNGFSPITSDYEMRITTTVRYHRTLMKMAKTEDGRHLRTKDAGDKVDERSSHLAGGGTRTAQESMGGSG